MPLSCRFYKEKFPNIEDVVCATVVSIAEMGAYAHLSEYNDTEGMILMSELSRRRIRSINKLIRVGRSEYVMVLRVDKEKGYIDLSKRRAAPEDIKKCEERFSKAKAVNSILKHVGFLLGYERNEQLEELYSKTAWYFDEKYGERAASYNVFKHAVIKPEVLDECDLDNETKECLARQICMKLSAQPVKIRTDVEVMCYSYEGIDAIKAALKKGLALSTEELPIKINLIAPPTYVMTITTLEQSEGLKRIREAIDAIHQEILKSNGRFQVKSEPRVVSDNEEALLAEQLERLRVMNEEREGDEDSDDDAGSLPTADDDDPATAALNSTAAGDAATTNGDSELTNDGVD